MALRDINLIPGDMLYQQQLQRHVYFWAGCVAMSLTLVVGIYLSQRHAIMAEKKTLTKLKTEHQQLAAKVEEIKQIQEELQKLEEKQAVLNDIAGNQAYSQVLLKLAEIMNEHTWLKQLSIERDKETENRDDEMIKLKLTGFSHSNEDLGDFLIQLSSQPLFKGVVLNYAKEATDRRAKGNMTLAASVIEFQIDCHV
jgi:Tfp pilus assembly protein PilN